VTADHYAVTASELTAGAGTVNGLSGDAQNAANALLSSIAALTNAAGDAGLAGSLGNLGTAAAKSSTVLITVLTQVADTLTQNAATYQKQEDQVIRATQGVR
jgi:uncharacterized protein YukE